MQCIRGPGDMSLSASVKKACLIFSLDSTTNSVPFPIRHDTTDLHAYIEGRILGAAGISRLNLPLTDLKAHNMQSVHTTVRTRSPTYHACKQTSMQNFYDLTLVAGRLAPIILTIVITINMIVFSN